MQKGVAMRPCFTLAVVAASHASQVIAATKSTTAGIASYILNGLGGISTAKPSPLPIPLTTYRNHTYATSCGYLDTACFDTCVTYSQSCSSEWDLYAYGSGGSAIATATTESTYYDTQSTTIVGELSTSTYTFTIEESIANSTALYTGQSTIALASEGSPSVSLSVSPFTYTSVLYSFTNTYAAPTCNTTVACTSACNPNYCTVQGGTVELLYWPVATTSLYSGNDGEQRTSIIPISGDPAKTVTAMYDGITLVSPTVYISFQTAFALDECSSPVGHNHTGSIVAVQPSDLSSIHGSLGPQYITASSAHFRGSWVPAPFNYTNMALTPVPLDVYLDQPSCYDSFCSTIYTDYRPVLSIPKQVLGLDPAWSACDVYWEGVYDPPRALQQAESVAGVSTPGGYDGTRTTQAAPESSLSAPTVTPTALPEEISSTTHASTSTSDPVFSSNETPSSGQAAVTSDPRAASNPTSSSENRTATWNASHIVVPTSRSSSTSIITFGSSTYTVVQETGIVTTSTPMPDPISHGSGSLSVSSMNSTASSQTGATDAVATTSTLTGVASARVREVGCSLRTLMVLLLGFVNLV